MLYYVCSVVHFFVFIFLQISPFFMPGIKGYQNYPLKMGAIGTRNPDGYGAAFELAIDHLGP